MRRLTATGAKQGEAGTTREMLAPWARAVRVSKPWAADMASWCAAARPAGAGRRRPVGLTRHLGGSSLLWPTIGKTLGLGSDARAPPRWEDGRPHLAHARPARAGGTRGGMTRGAAATAPGPPRNPSGADHRPGRGRRRAGRLGPPAACRVAYSVQNRLRGRVGRGPRLTHRCSFLAVTLKPW